MGFVKVVKNRAYHKRYQVKFKRRRECKTDYKQRISLITQDKNKYQTPKYRFVVRITNRDIICQIFSADLTHDVCLASAYSHELQGYGIKVGLSNYSAAYATGLLLARRVNTKFKLNYEGKKVVNGEDFNVKPKEEYKAPFKAFLDIGLARTTTGARIFGALKGACDGGLDVPHNSRRFPGSYRDEDTKKWAYSPEKHRELIFGVHVANYMKVLQENDKAAYEKQFSRYIKAGISADDVEEMWKKCHTAIRKNPNLKRNDKQKGYFGIRTKPKPSKPKKRLFNKKKLSRASRRNRVQQKIRKAQDAKKKQAEQKEDK